MVNYLLVKQRWLLYNIQRITIIALFCFTLSDSQMVSTTKSFRSLSTILASFEIVLYGIA